MSSKKVATGKGTKTVRRSAAAGKPTIGFIGQGFVGKSYADDFERRGYPVVRYANVPPYEANKLALKSCDIVFVAVPTPTTPRGFDASILHEVLNLPKPGSTVVIKSTVLPGMTKELQEKFPDIFLIHSPEFLSEATAAHDAANPKRVIVGVPAMSEEYRRRAEDIIKHSPNSPFTLVCDSTEAELIKYARNVIGYARVILANIFYDYATELGASWEPIRAAVAADPDNGPTYLNPLHKSGRGAGGNCFIKDMAAFRREIERIFKRDKEGVMLLKALEQKNHQLLTASGKDLHLLHGVYGKKATRRHAKGR